MNTRALRFILALGLILPLAGICSAQTTLDKTLVLNGRTLAAGVRQIDGHSYVDIETLAQATNGVVTVEPNRVVLTIPVANAGATAAAAAPAANPEALSRDFASSAIAEVADMREWRGAIGSMVTYGLAVPAAMAQDYHDRAQDDLRQVTLAASTDGDRDALQLLRAELDNLAGWASEVLTARQNLNGAKTVDPNGLNNDPSLAKITACSRSLNAMLISGAFSDVGTCH
jgi:hypothetical protein